MTYIILTIILINLILIYFLKKKEIKKIIFKKKIVEKKITDIHPIFRLNKKKYNFPTENYITKFLIVPSELNIIGMTSDLEAWILCMISKVSYNIFEFGTCSGKTTFLLGLNSPEDAKITTLTIKSDEKLSILNNESKSAFQNIFHESEYEEFMFTNTYVQKKINVRFINSLKFDENEFKDKCDLIFIDGGHTYSIVKNDSEKALKMISKKGYIFWHDYVPGKRSSKDVYRYLNELSKTHKLFSIPNTTLVYFKNE
jgi:hypothetical protein